MVVGDQEGELFSGHLLLFRLLVDSDDPRLVRSRLNRLEPDAASRHEFIATHNAIHLGRWSNCGHGARHFTPTARWDACRRPSLLGSKQNGHGSNGRQRPNRNAGGGASRHLRVVPRHRLRMVRLLSLRDFGAVLRGVVLPAGQRDGGPAVGLRGLRGGLPGAPVRRPRVRPPG
jgi:hypothetical protein